MQNYNKALRYPLNLFFWMPKILPSNDAGKNEP